MSYFPPNVSILKHKQPALTYLCPELILLGCKLASGVPVALWSGVIMEFALDKLDTTSAETNN